MSNRNKFHLLGRPYGRVAVRARPHKALDGPKYDSGDEPFPSPSAGEMLARGPAASPKAYSVLAGFEKWMVEIPCARGANVSSRNLDSWPSECYAFLPERWVVSQVRTFRGHAFVRHRATDGPLKPRAVLVVLGPLAAGRHSSALRASRKSKHLPPAVVVLGRDTCDTGRVTLGWRVGVRLGRPALEKKATARHLLILGPTSLRIGRYIRPREIESSGLGLGCLDDAVAKHQRALLLAAGRLHYAMHYAEAEQTSHDVQVVERGRATSRVSNRVRFARQVSGAQAKATVCRSQIHTYTHKHTHTRSCSFCCPAKGLGKACKQQCHDHGRQIRRPPSTQVQQRMEGSVGQQPY